MTNKKRLFILVVDSLQAIYLDGKKEEVRKLSDNSLSLELSKEDISSTATQYISSDFFKDAFNSEFPNTVDENELLEMLFIYGS